jgi:hypothetical protein
VFCLLTQFSCNRFYLHRNFWCLVHLLCIWTVESIKGDTHKPHRLGSQCSVEVFRPSFLGDSAFIFLSFRWLDVTPTSRILARVTNDVRSVDGSIGNHFWDLCSMLISMMVRIFLSAQKTQGLRSPKIKFCAVILYVPSFLLPGAFVGALGAWVGQIYIAGQLPVKRLMSNSRAPVLAQYVPWPLRSPSLDTFQFRRSYRRIGY